MKIGVKYCGGCNPYYERKTAVEQLNRRFADVVFETAVTDKEYDVILLVCGCKRACIKDSKN